MSLQNYSAKNLYTEVADIAYPEYSNLLNIREEIDDCLEGLRTSEEKQKYLKPTKWQQKHKDAFQEFLYRALFPFETKYALDIYTGLFQLGNPLVTLPEKLDYMIKHASARDDGLKSIQVRLNQEQMSHGLRMLLLECRPNDTEKPLFIQEYSANKFIRAHFTEKNGEIYPDIILLNESTVNNDFFTLSYIPEIKIRILAIDGAGRYYQRQVAKEELIQFDYDNPPVDGRTVYPVCQGRTLDRIPFVWCGANGLSGEELDIPPLLPMAQKELKLFLCMAHNSQHIFMNTQEAIVITGAPGSFKLKDNEFVAGAAISIPGENTKVQYLSTNGIGFDAEEKEIERLHQSIEQQRLSLMSAKSHQSGTVVGLVQNSQSAPLRTIVTVSGMAITKILLFAAKWLDLSKEETESISYEPSQKFANAMVNLSEFISLCKAVQANEVKMLESDLYAIGKESGLINSKLSWEQFKEKYEIEAEERLAKSSVLPKKKGSIHPLNGKIPPVENTEE